MTDSIVGKTVESVEVKAMAGRDAYKDWVMWERTVITFTDQATISFDSWDGEVWDEFEHNGVDEDGQPIPIGQTEDETPEKEEA